ncbi:MAG: protoheme IX farnesyltransferase [Alphaproteobacteria bacterium]|nr:protoheme IX farnesyltransferase [Alphaproteobacteria bacterium]
MKATAAPHAVPLWRDLIALAKPRIILLLAITCLCGGLVAAKGNLELLQLSALPLAWATLGLCVAAAGANSVNMAWDRDIDPLMRRTANRPLPQGRLGHRFVYLWGSLLMALGTLLAATAAPWAGVMNLAGALFYVFIYTMLLKRRTVQNIVIGGAAGAFPPLVGWAAVQGDVSHPLPWLMFAIIFAWTPPHFWALALFMNADYTKAKIPMYPVVHGAAATRVMIVRYLMVLVPLTLLGGLYAPLGWLYSLAALSLGLWWSHAAWQLLHAPRQGMAADTLARLTFRRSLFYLGWLFVAMVVDSLV